MVRKGDDKRDPISAIRCDSTAATQAITAVLIIYRPYLRIGSERPNISSMISVMRAQCFNKQIDLPRYSNSCNADLAIALPVSDTAPIQTWTGRLGAQQRKVHIALERHRVVVGYQLTRKSTSSTFSRLTSIPVCASDFVIVD